MAKASQGVQWLKPTARHCVSLLLGPVVCRMAVLNSAAEQQEFRDL